MLDACTARTLRGMHIRSDRGILNILSGFGHHRYILKKYSVARKLLDWCCDCKYLVTKGFGFYLFATHACGICGKFK